MKAIKIKNVEYYEITDANGEKMLLDKARSGPIYFKGCVDHCIQNNLGSIEYDSNGDCCLYVILEESTIKYFKEWVSEILGIEETIILDPKNKWKKLCAGQKKSSFTYDMLAYKGKLDVYTILRYFYSSSSSYEIPWLNQYVELHKSIKDNIN